ncbi:hypothetical protein MtrunA17_Chr1g0162461 [Medicago truncatula]|uniref:Uncharacterized protein n=1 Tax=Medicago truncatula TaxID=3880 RepID=A0A396JIV7_MEDTR|nr:hypothetical protein MtrunA17_Chr1g0162461 [Medicago truncatula]
MDYDENLVVRICSFYSILKDYDVMQHQRYNNLKRTESYNNLKLC